MVHLRPIPAGVTDVLPWLIRHQCRRRLSPTGRAQCANLHCP